MTDLQTLPRYDRLQTYLWNYENAPDPVECEIPRVPGEWSFCGLPVESPLGMPAGPLLNGKWILYYASLGFDVLTYKTTRSVLRECYDLPNLLPITTGQLSGGETNLPASEEMQGSWAVSFGMPSALPKTWQADIEWTRKQLPKNKVLSVSVVGSVQEGWSIEDLADDYAQCARWAVESGADCVETNFSCPNVSTCDGQLYQQPEAAALVTAKVRDTIGKTPFIVKAGHLNEEAEASALLDAIAPYVNSIAMTNSVATTIRSASGELHFDGQQRGICGDATRAASLRQTKLFDRLIKERNLEIKIIGVGGAGTAEHVREYLEAGAESVHIATAAMADPGVGLKIRREL